MVPQLLYERDDGGYMVALGDPAQVSREAVKKSLLADGVLSDQWQKTREDLDLLEEPRPSHEQVRLALRDLASDSSAERHPSLSLGDKAGSTYYWKRAT